MRRDTQYCCASHRKTGLRRRQKQTGDGYRRPSERHMTSWTPRAETEELLSEVEDVLDHYSNQLPVTVRQILYVLVARGRPKNESFTKQLYRALRLGRRFGRIDFEDIRDDTGVHLAGIGEREADTGPIPYVEQAKQRARDALADNLYRRGRHEGQPYHIDLWCEAAGMAPQLSRWVGEYGVEVHSGRGFHGLSVKWRMAQRIAERELPTLLFHIGDLDWHGGRIFKALDEDLEGFADDAKLEIVRLAVTEEQVKRLGLTVYGGAVQAEAIPPDELERIVRAAVCRYYDEDVARRVREREAKEREEVDRRLAELRARAAYSEALLRAFGWPDDEDGPGRP